MKVERFVMATSLGVILVLVLGIRLPSARADDFTSNITNDAPDIIPTPVIEGAGPVLLPQVAAPGATAKWWAAVQSYIQADLGANGFGSAADWTANGQNSGDNFAKTVAGAGDVNGDGYADVIVGAYGYDSLTGRAYVFYGSHSGLSTAPDWTATGENTGDNFGNSVAGAGDVNGDGYSDVVIGAPFHSAGGHTTNGKAYVFLGSRSGLSTTPNWSDTGLNDSAHFGLSVAGAGDVNRDGYADIIIGIPGSPTEGKISLYQGSSSGVEASAAWSGFGKSGENDEGLGWAVAGAGDINGDGYADIVAGVFDHDEGIGDNQGRVYVYYGPVDVTSTYGDWVYTGVVTNCNLGRSVAGAGDVNGDGYSDIIVGAENCGSDQGQALIFYGHAGGPGSTPDWSVLGENTNDLFGRSVAGIGDVDGDGYSDVAVGAPGVSSGQGRIYAFRGGSGGVSTTHFWSATGGSGAYQGRAVAGAGDVNGDGYADLIGGAPGYSSSRGQALLFHGVANAPNTTAAWDETGDSQWARFGIAVASAGDVNGDGYSDVVIGAAGYPNNDAQGKAYLFLGTASGLAGFPVWTDVGEHAGDRFGCSVAGAGDVNGDGYGDVIVGANEYDDDSTSTPGKVYVYYGNATGLSTNADWAATGLSSNENLGVAVAGAGDVNGDGFADVIVGASDYSPTGQPSAGKACLFLGSASGLGDNAVWSAVGEAGYDFFGRAVAGAGDVNGDGFADVIVGAYGYDLDTASGAGKAYVYHGSATGFYLVAAWSDSGWDTASDQFGWSVAGAGDVNGDGFGDIIVGAPGHNSNKGSVLAYYGSSGGLSLAHSWSLGGGQASGLLGSSVAGAGDVNGDGYADVIYGASGVNWAFVSAGGPTGIASSSVLWAASGDSSTDFGAAVAGAGDINGDGYADLLVAAPEYGVNHEGRAYAYFGNGETGRPVLPQQARADGSRRAVQPWGLSHTPDGMYLTMSATHPLGRGRAKLQVEACPPGEPFGGAACIHHLSATWKDTTATISGVRVATTVSGFDADTLYHWRARVLYAPYTVSRAGITPPPNPAHGPWRRLLAQVNEADIRTVNWMVYLPLVLCGQ